jgi:hypothetical protein
MEDTILKFGPYALPFPVALSAILAILYSFFDKADGSSYLSNRTKNGLALLCGAAFGWYLLLCCHVEITPELGIGWTMFGVLEGAAAVGLYKTVKTWTEKGGPS